MESQPEQGILVKDIRGRHLGKVAAVRACCVQIADSGWSVQRDAVIAVNEFAMELICDAEQIGRYRCKVHSTLASAD